MPQAVFYPTPEPSSNLCPQEDVFQEEEEGASAQFLILNSCQQQQAASPNFSSAGFWKLLLELAAPAAGGDQTEFQQNWESPLFPSLSAPNSHQLSAITFCWK